MSETRFSLGAHELQLVSDLSGKKRIIYDKKTVSEKRNFGLSSRHQFEATESGELAKYDVTFKTSFSGFIYYTVKRNDVLVKKGAINAFAGGLLRIFFFFIGLTLTCNSLFLVWYINALASIPIPSRIPWLYIDIGIKFIFGTLFLTFAFFLNKIILKIPNFIIIVLWVRLGLLLIAFSLTLGNLLQGNVFLDDILLRVIFIRIVFILLYWFLLKNVKQISLGLRETPNQ